MANPVTLSDVEDRYPTVLSDRQLINAAAWLTDAWWLLTTKLPDLETNIEDELVAVENVRRVVVSMVHRMLKNPEGLLTEAIDDYSYRRAQNVASGALTVSADEMSELTPGGRRRVHSIRLVAYGET